MEVKHFKNEEKIRLKTHKKYVKKYDCKKSLVEGNKKKKKL